MMRRADFEGIESAPRWIVIFLAANLAAGFLVAYVWNAAGNLFSMQASSGSTSAFSVTVLTAVDLWLSIEVLRRFPRRAPLHSAWLWILLAAAVRFMSETLASLAVCGGSTALALCVPIQWAMLAAAMAQVLRVFHRLGFWRGPRAADWAVCAVVWLFTLRRSGVLVAAWLDGQPTAGADWISLAGLPILCALFLAAMLLRQSLASMGNGLVTRGWAALVYAIFLTGAAEMALWIIPHYFHSLPLLLLASLARLPMAAAFALVPAWQVAAQRHAIQPGSAEPEELPTGLPAMAE